METVQVIELVRLKSAIYSIPPGTVGMLDSVMGDMGHVRWCLDGGHLSSGPINMTDLQRIGELSVPVSTSGPPKPKQPSLVRLIGAATELCNQLDRERALSNKSAPGWQHYNALQSALADIEGVDLRYIPEGVVAFIYHLGRDHLPLGALTHAGNDAADACLIAGEPPEYTNKELEAYARRTAERLR